MISETLALTRRSFFGAASAAVVAACASRRAYSFLTANPFAAPFADVNYAGPNSWTGGLSNDPRDDLIAISRALRLYRTVRLPGRVDYVTCKIGFSLEQAAREREGYAVK